MSEPSKDKKYTRPCFRCGNRIWSRQSIVIITDFYSTADLLMNDIGRKLDNAGIDRYSNYKLGQIWAEKYVIVFKSITGCNLGWGYGIAKYFIDATRYADEIMYAKEKMEEIKMHFRPWTKQIKLGELETVLGISDGENE